MKENTYVIHKSSRLPDNVHGSYKGDTWKRADILEWWQPFYQDFDLALHLARTLTEYNPGCPFEVTAVESDVK